MEKIKDISITNFKSIKHLEINDCNKINVFIGMPNAGKSNILEAISLFGMIRGTLQYDFKTFVRFKDIIELFFEENTSDEILIKINKEPLNFNYEKNNLNSERTYSFFNEKLRFEENVRRKLRRINPVKKYIFRDVNFRENSNREILSYPFGENLIQVILSNPLLRKEVNKLFNENNLKLLIEKKTNELKIFKEYQDGTFFTLPFELIADTLQRLIFYKAAIMSNKNSVLLFEEPEAHCFEPYILEFTNAIKYDENDNQFFIVTHSDFIIQEFLRDVESNKNTNIYLVNNVDGETKVKLLNKEKNDDVYEFGMNAFFNFESLWESN